LKKKEKTHRQEYLICLSHLLGIGKQTSIVHKNTRNLLARIRSFLRRRRLLPSRLVLSECDLLFCLLAGSCCQVQMACSQQLFGWAPAAATRLLAAAAGLRDALCSPVASLLQMRMAGCCCLMVGS
jgi:hypothetical protein